MKRLQVQTDRVLEECNRMWPLCSENSSVSLGELYKIALWILVLLAILVVLTGCGGDSGARVETAAPEATATAMTRPSLTVWAPNGSAKIVETLKPLAETTGLPYELRVYDGPSTDAGLRGLIDGTFDMMIIMNHPSAQWALIFREFVYVPIGIFVHPALGIDYLTREDVKMIFSGEVTNWSQIGGPDQAIYVVIQEDDDTMTTAMRDYFLDGQLFVESAHIVADEFALFGIVESIEGAIGYASWSGKKYLELTSPTGYMDAIQIDGLAPSDEAYPFMSSVGFAYLPERQDFLLPFFEWVDHFIALNTVALLLDRFGVRLAGDGLSSGPDNAADE